MTVRRPLLAWVALLAACWGSGCVDRDGSPLPPETEDPFYVQGKQLQKQGRQAEALNAFLKVIDRRGEAPSPESHLEAGLLCLYHTRDFPAAYYHLRRYHRAQPNSKEAPLVLGKIEEAKREFARTLPGRPLEDQSVRLAQDEEVARLRRENDELRAEVAVLRGGGAVPVPRIPRLIALPPEIGSAPFTPSPPIAPVAGAPARAAPADSSPLQRAGPAATASTRAGIPAGTPPAAARSAGRTHTVAPKDTLYSLARRYQVRVEDIVAANPAVLPRASTPLRIGTMLRIP